MKVRKVMMVLMACFILISVSLPAMAAGELTATRSFSSPEVSPGENFTVTVDLTVNSNIFSPAIDEELPDSWTVTQVTRDGLIYDPKTHEWVLTQSLYAGDSTTIAYKVTVPSDTPEGSYSITGQVSAFQVDPSKIMGDEVIVVSAASNDPEVVPDADFSANVDSGTFPLTVQFTDISTNAPAAWEWDFDNDGTVDSTVQNPEYTFISAANYDVTLTVTNSAGSDTVTKVGYISVFDPDDSNNDPSDEPTNDGSENGTLSSAVYLGADIIPAIGIVVTPGNINFGALGPGDVSDVKVLNMYNRGADDAIITTEVIDAADDLFIGGLHMGNGMWNDYTTLLASKEQKNADLTLHVPSDYAKIGSMKGILVV